MPQAKSTANSKGKADVQAASAAESSARTPVVAADEEQVVDLEEEERARQQSSPQSSEETTATDKRVDGEPALAHRASGPGMKLILDLLLRHDLSQETWDFVPHHTNVIVQASPTPELMVTLDINPVPVYFEVQWDALPNLSLKAGKILIPFGSNSFHHLIGGRVDELSEFLPEVWSDYGIGLNHRAYDGDTVFVEYDLYIVNGFQGETTPDVLQAQVATENNRMKGVGGRAKVGLWGHYDFIGSLYYDRWDAESKYALMYYSLALQIGEGFVRLPILNRLRLRGEWARGEIQLPSTPELQHGLLWHAYARTGFYAEIQGRALDNMALRLRLGQLNPNNTVSDDRDIFLVEPAVVLGSSVVSVVFAYELCFNPNTGGWDPSSPGDVFYTKFFIQY